MSNELRRYILLIENAETVRVWFNTRTRKTIPVTTQEDHGASIYEWPETFGLSYAAVEQANQRFGMDGVILLAMKRGWVRINDQPDGHQVPLVMAASDRWAQQGVAWLAQQIAGLRAVQVEILIDPTKPPSSMTLRGSALTDFSSV
jgi:hypothetical protein